MTVMKALKRRDRSYFSDQDQTELFSHTVREILQLVAGSLPAPYWVLLHTSNGMEAEETEGMVQRLTTLVGSSLSLPYLDEEMKLQAVRGVTELVWYTQH